MRLQFGNVIVDDDSRLLLRDGASVHVSPKAFDLLATLLRERPRVLSKEDLHARLWPKTFVTDASLAMLVAEVRAAIGENAREPRWLRTVHRKGYAFQGDAEEVASVPLTASAAAAPARRGTEVGYWLVASSRQIPLQPGENIVGRDPGVGVWLDSPSVSRRHARILVEGHRVTLEDLGSKNGTRVGETVVTTETALGDGAELRFGSVGVTFRAWAAEPTLTQGGS